MNQSVYLMVSVPYVVFGFGAFLVYRGCKKNAEYRKRFAPPDDPSPSPPV
jgi:hypothetical protein